MLALFGPVGAQKRNPHPSWGEASVESAAGLVNTKEVLPFMVSMRDAANRDEFLAGVDHLGLDRSRHHLFDSSAHAEEKLTHFREGLSYMSLRVQGRPLRSPLVQDVASHPPSVKLC